jgi:hypothetical protein
MLSLTTAMSSMTTDRLSLVLLVTIVQKTIRLQARTQDCYSLTIVLHLSEKKSHLISHLAGVEALCADSALAPYPALPSHLLPVPDGTSHAICHTRFGHVHWSGSSKTK